MGFWNFLKIPKESFAKLNGLELLLGLKLARLELLKSENLEDEGWDEEGA